ncbi:MBL fold metallo-hydrolase [bacterium]|nr:MBL fold metallo-hydrolase [candidate division CSSED10-310 bacterium]
MIMLQIKSGGDRNFSYIIGDESSRLCAVIDPGYHPQKLHGEARNNNLNVKFIICTHNHFDHTAALGELKRITNATTVGYGSQYDISVVDNTNLDLGHTQLTFIHTPGHTPDSICILAGNKLFTGDTLFVGKVGGTAGNQDARQEYESIHNKILALPENTEIYPGHDYGTAPFSTVSAEKRTNPFILQENFEKFLNLKKNWLAYKKEHGIK